MNVNTGDIISYKSSLYLSQEYILDHAGISAGYLRVAKSRANKGTSESWQNVELHNTSYFKYANIPASSKCNLPTRDNLQMLAVRYDTDIVSLINTAKEDTTKDFLGLYKNDEDLALAAAIIHEANKYIINNKVSFAKSAFFDELADEIKLQDLKHLPKTWRNVRDKVQEYHNTSKITDLVFAKNKGNNHRTKFANDETIKAWLITFIESQKNYSAAFIHRKVKRMSLQSGIDHPSVRWISNFLADPETQYLTQQRYGSNSRFNRKYIPSIPTKTAVFAGDCWQIDGTRVNIIDHKATYINKQGKKVTGQKFLYIIAVRDVMSGMPLGWEYCYEETADAVINALAMAVRTAGYLPYEFVYDRFPGHNTTEWQTIETYMRAKGTRMTIAYKADGKANIERWWGTLQDVFMMDSDLYYGQGIKSTRRHAHRSKEYVQSMRQWANKNHFNYDDACKETDKIVNSYLNTPFSEYSTKFKSIDQSPMELHEESDKPNTYPITDHDWCFLFGLNKQVSIFNYMIHTQIDNAHYYYGIDDCDVIAKYTGVKLTNCFDYENLDTVHLYDGDEYVGSFAGIEPAQQFGPDRDMRAVGRLKSIATKVDTDRKAKRAKIKDTELDVAIQHEASEVNMMQGGILPKHTYEDSESAFLLEEWDEGDVVITAKHQY
ncbi:integrase catalytic domain-containing protein [Dysgonomonas sp. ZJ279]|uniref:integrase catalytic domain-containing protein n=1 Tax=Dysgonomonas sp. ZJ279 TaxID=2709796 RepID=UPI0013ED0FCC|nr:DDE-type integrase/transposase/recombinase [Dysgonomonas sp. ZJ279]